MREQSRLIGLVLSRAGLFRYSKCYLRGCSSRETRQENLAKVVSKTRLPCSVRAGCSVLILFWYGAQHLLRPDRTVVTNMEPCLLVLLTRCNISVHLLRACLPAALSVSCRVRHDIILVLSSPCIKSKLNNKLLAYVSRGSNVQGLANNCTHHAVTPNAVV